MLPEYRLNFHDSVLLRSLERPRKATRTTGFLEGMKVMDLSVPTSPAPAPTNSQLVKKLSVQQTLTPTGRKIQSEWVENKARRVWWIAKGWGCRNIPKISKPLCDTLVSDAFFCAFVLARLRKRGLVVFRSNGCWSKADMRTKKKNIRKQIGDSLSPGCKEIRPCLPQSLNWLCLVFPAKNFDTNPTACYSFPPFSIPKWV